jgi:ABC-type sugar transport system substrate-binding protein
MGSNRRAVTATVTGALVLAAVAACSSSTSTTAAAGNSPTATPSSTSPSAPASAAAVSTCGKIPTVAYNDQSGEVSALGSYAANYNGFDGTIYKSPWATWAGKSNAKIGILIDGLTNPYQTALEGLLESGLKADGYTTIADAPAPTVTAQLQGYQTLLGDGVNLIIVQSQSNTAYNSLIDKAASEGIPTVGVLNDVNDQNAVNVVPNSVLDGMELTQYVVQQAGGKGTILFLHGIAGAPIDTDTATGALDVLKQCPGITVNDSIQTEFQAPIAKQEVLSYLNTHPGTVSGVVTAGPFTSGVIEAFEQAGKTVPVITNNGLDLGGLAYWLEHESTYKGVALANTADGLAYATDEVVQKMLQGDGVKINTIAIVPPVVTSAELSTYVDLSGSSAWTINTAGTASGPASTFVSSAFIDAVFNK